MGNTLVHDHMINLLGYHIPRGRGAAFYVVNRTAAEDTAEKLGFKLEMSRDIEALRHCLRTGGAAVILVRGDRDGQVGLFTHGAHYMAVINEEPDGRMAILDPSFKDTKYTEEGRVGKVEVTKHGIILVEAKHLVEEAHETSMPYYLFWRK